MEIHCIWDGHATLGESPLWDYREQALYWVDIDGALLHRIDPNNHDHQQWQLPTKIGAIGLHAHGGLIAALRHGFAHIALPSGDITLLDQPIADREDVMFNDGKVDRQGRFWAGTKHIKETEDAAILYRLDPNGSVSQMDDGFTVTNGMAWSPDNTLMYHTDSPKRVIYQYDFDPSSGSINNKRIFVNTKPDAGYPDGSTVDSEGYLWGTHWGGWRITRYAPDGSIDREIAMPIQQVTSCCFGGPNLDILYVTSAARGLSMKERRKQPQAGGVFAIAVDIKGLPEPVYQGET